MPTCRHGPCVNFIFCTLMFSPNLKLELSYILSAGPIFHVFANSHIITLVSHLGDGSFMLSVTVQSRLTYQTQILNVESRDPVQYHLLRIKSS